MDAGGTQAGLPSWFRAAWPAALAGLLLGLLALGPGLGRGFLLSYDMVAVPRQPFTAAMFGWGGGLPRAVPSDAVVAAAARVLPADIVQKLFLLPIFVLAAAGRPPLLAGRALAGPAGRRGLLRVEPVRRRAAHHRPVGAAARLRRAALGAGRGDPARGHLVALGRAAGAGLAARGGRRVLRHVHLRAGRAARGRLRSGLRRRREPAIGRGSGAPRPTAGALRRLRSLAWRCWC